MHSTSSTKAKNSPNPQRFMWSQTAELFLDRRNNVLLSGKSKAPMKDVSGLRFIELLASLGRGSPGLFPNRAPRATIDLVKRFRRSMGAPLSFGAAEYIASTIQSLSKRFPAESEPYMTPALSGKTGWSFVATKAAATQIVKEHQR